MSALFVCDAGPGVGLGHAMRSAVLANAFRQTGRRVRMCVPEGGLGFVPERLKAQLPVFESDAPQRETADLAVLDSYRLARDACPQATKTIAFDDGVGASFAADIVLDTANVGRSVAPAVRHLRGPRYAPVADAFAVARPTALARREAQTRVSRVLVSFGGADADDATGRTLDALHGRDFAVDVAVGAQSAHLERLKRRTDARVRLHIDSDDMPALMAQADLAVGAGGSTAWERCTLGLPSLVARLAANQNGVVDTLAKAGAAIDLGTIDAAYDARLAAALAQMQDPDARRHAGAAAATLCDGRGAKRIALAAAVGTHAAVGWRAADESDETWLFELQSMPETRRYARNSQAPDLSTHRRWYADLLRNPARTLAVLEMQGQAVGFVRLDPCGSDAAPKFEVSIAVAPSFHGRGIGRAGLSLARACARDAILVATVLDANTASRRLFETCGYRPAGPQLLESHPS